MGELAKRDTAGPIWQSAGEPPPQVARLPIRDRRDEASRETRVAGLSLGDDACLALGLLQEVPVVTTDRHWAKADVGLEIHVIP